MAGLHETDPRETPKCRIKEIAVPHNTNSKELPTLESILALLDQLKPGNSSFELFLPNRTTFRNRNVSGSFPSAVVLDRALREGLTLIGTDHQTNGKLLRFERLLPIDSSSLRTEPPPFDVTKQVPALAPLAQITIRLHPRRAVDTELAGSKLGGTFLWPSSEPWPCCDDPVHEFDVNGRSSPTDGMRPHLLPLAQLNARDFPTIPFRFGTDLLQLLWCPNVEDGHDDLYMFPKLFAYWRNSAEINDPVSGHPIPEFSDSLRNHFPICCYFFPETVQEFPSVAGIYELPQHDEIHDALALDESIWQQYQDELSSCPSTKLGGHPFWIQNDETPLCEFCGMRMEFLLQFCDWEYTNMDVTQRWIPLADRWAVITW